MKLKSGPISQFVASAVVFSDYFWFRQGLLVNFLYQIFTVKINFAFGIEFVLAKYD